MDQKWIQILVILVFFQKMPSGADKVMFTQEGKEVEINCKPDDMGSMIIWFRVLDQSKMEFIASFSNNGIKKSFSASLETIFGQEKIKENILKLKSFNKTRDSGIYSCATIKGSELKFGQVTRLVGAEVAAPLTTTTTTTRKGLRTTTTACVCNNKQGETSPSMSCSPIILGPLAGGCGLLLLLLIVTTLYCNQIRTRRCPHHYKRKPRMTAPGKQMKTNRHV